MPRGRSLHIGVNRVDPACYCWKEYGGSAYALFVPSRGGDAASGLGDAKLEPVGGERYVIGWSGPLGQPPDDTLGCEKDADDMAELARRQGFAAIQVLKTREATAAAVTTAIERAAAELEPGDTFFVTYSGHGAHVKDLGNDEPEGYDETWCLYDRMLLDDEQAYLYSRFRPGVRIFVLLDSCHSGTGTRKRASREPAPALAASIQERCAPRGLDKSVYEYEANARYYDELQRALLVKIEQGCRDDPRIGRRNLEVVSISACQDGQKAHGDKLQGGWLTNAVTAAFAEIATGSSARPPNYLELFDRIVAILQRDHPEPRQDPQLDHGLSMSRVLPAAIRAGRACSGDEWAAELTLLDARREDRDPPLAPLTADEIAALERLALFLAEPPLRIE